HCCIAGVVQNEVAWLYEYSHRCESAGDRVRLLQRYGITAVDPANLQHRGVDPNISSVVLCCCSQDTYIFWEIGLRERRHHAAGARTGDAQANSIADRNRLPDPSILHKIFLAGIRLHDYVWTEPPNLEAPLWIKHSKPIDRGRGQQMHDGTIEKGTLRQAEIRDCIPVVEPFDIRPVFFGCGRRHTGLCEQGGMTLHYIGRYIDAAA